MNSLARQAFAQAQAAAGDHDVELRARAAADRARRPLPRRRRAREPLRQRAQVLARAREAARDDARKPRRRRVRLRDLATTGRASTCSTPTSCSACSSACTRRPRFRAPASASRWSRRSSSATAAACGPRARSIAARASRSRCPPRGAARMNAHRRESCWSTTTATTSTSRCARRAARSSASRSRCSTTAARCSTRSASNGDGAARWRACARARSSSICGCPASTAGRSCAGCARTPTPGTSP